MYLEDKTRLKHNTKQAKGYKKKRKKNILKLVLPQVTAWMLNWTISHDVN